MEADPIPAAAPTSPEEETREKPRDHTIDTQDDLEEPGFEAQRLEGP